MNHPTKLLTPLVSSCLLTALITTPLHNANAGAIEDAFADSKAFIDVRYRYEGADDSVNLDAKASILRTRLGLTTSTKKALYAHIDFENITHVITDDDYNSTTNGNVTFAKVPDPNESEVNQAFLNYTFSPALSVKAGRQRIIYDNARFVGNVGWRMNEQTYDAVQFTSNISDSFSLKLANIQQINTFTATETATNIQLINANLKKLGSGNLTAYAYLLDFDAAPNTATSTFGVRYKGAADKLLYTLEYAKQQDYADNAGSFDADYLFAEVGYKVAEKTKVFLAMETLGSDGGAVAFQTPLATKHAFNGWADKFLATPATGLTDTYVKVVSWVEGIKLVGIYHDFSADSGSANYGTELDLLAVKKLNKTYSLLAKYASYSADTFSVDTDKFWLQLNMKLSQ